MNSFRVFSNKNVKVLQNETWNGELTTWKIFFHGSWFADYEKWNIFTTLDLFLQNSKGMNKRNCNGQIEFYFFKKGLFRFDFNQFFYLFILVFECVRSNLVNQMKTTWVQHYQIERYGRGCYWCVSHFGLVLFSSK